jgi:hypothetical protein
VISPNVLDGYIVVGVSIDALSEIAKVAGRTKTFGITGKGNRATLIIKEAKGGERPFYVIDKKIKTRNKKDSESAC